jgi:hypothetical protein
MNFSLRCRPDAVPDHHPLLKAALTAILNRSITLIPALRKEPHFIDRDSPLGFLRHASSP